MSLINLLKKGVTNVEHGIGNVAGAAVHTVAPIRTPAPQTQASRQVISTAPRPAPQPSFINRAESFASHLPAFTNPMTAALSVPKIHDAVYNATIKPVTATVSGLITEPIRQNVALATHNQAAAQASEQRKIQAINDSLPGQLIHGTARSAAELLATRNNIKQITPTNPLTKALLGTTPVQSIQQKVKGNYQAHANLPAPLRVGLAGAEGVGSAAMDAANLLPLGAVAKEAAPAVRDVVLNKPLRSVADSQLEAAQRARLSQQGYGAFSNVRPGDVQALRQVQRKLGVNANNVDAVDNLLANRQAYQNKLNNFHQKLQNLPIGMSMKAVGNTPDPLAALKQEALKHPDAGSFSAGILRDEIKTPVPKEFIDFNRANESDARTKLENLYNQAHAEAKPVAPQTDAQAMQELATVHQAPAEVPPAETVPASKLPPVTQNSLTRKVARQNLSPEAQKLVQGDGFVRNTKQLADQAAATADAQGLDKTIQSAHEAMAVEPGKISDTTVAHVQQAIERADAAGRTHDAVALHDSLSEHLRKQGQTIQAASLLYKLSPQGLLYKGLKDIKTSGTTVTPELEAKLRAATDAIKQSPNPEAKTLAQAQFHKLVADNIKKSAANGALSVWKAGLLSSPLTHAGNFASNETFNLLKNASNPLASGVDRLLALKTGQRTKVATLRGVGGGTAQGLRESKRTLQTGIDARNIDGNKYEVHGELNFKNPVVQKVFGDTSNGVFRAMSAGDQPVYYRNLKQNLYDISLADGKNKGLKGQALIDHANQMVANPTTQIAETAKLAAQKAVLGQDSKIASSISRIAQEHPALQAVVPFVKVPTNFLVRTLDFSPVGLGKAAVKVFQDAKAGRPFDQRALSEAVGEGLTGTGIIAVGAHLANNNLLSGQYPSNNPKEVQRWKAEGIQPNSVKLGGKWINLNYLGPIGLLLGAGKDYHTAAVQGDNGAMQALAGFGKGLAGQSFLTGFSGAANAINDPGRYGKNFIHSQAASVVPAWLNAVGNATDSNQRQADSTVDSVKARLPGVRNSLPVKNDVYGNPLKQRTGPVDISVDPLKPSNDLSNKNPVVKEVNRLHTVDPNNSDLQVTPEPIKSKTSVDGVNLKLNSKQTYELQQKVGQATQNAWAGAIKSDAYKNLDDTGKANMLNSIRQDATNLAQRQYVTDNNLGDLTKQASARVAALGQNQPNWDAYAQSAGNKAAGISNAVPIAKNIDTSSKDFLTKYNAMNTDQRDKAAYSDPTFDYKYAQAKYQNDLANNKLSKAGKIKAEAALAKAEVGQKYSKDVRDLYGGQISKSDLYTYLSTPEKGVDKKKLANDILAYDNALYDAGVISSRKFHNKYGSVTLTASNSSGKIGTKKKSGSTKSKMPALAAMTTDYSGTSKLTNAALAGIKLHGSSHKISGGKVALRTYHPTKATIKKPKGVLA